jgi:hypothetical protein
MVIKLDKSGRLSLLFMFLVLGSFIAVGFAAKNQQWPFARLFPTYEMDQAYQVEFVRLNKVCGDEECRKQSLSRTEWELSNVYAQPSFKSKPIARIISFFTLGNQGGGNLTFGFDLVLVASTKRLHWKLVPDGASVEIRR